MKLLIFKSEITKAVYSWNGQEVVTIIAAKHRPIGKIMKGIAPDLLHDAYDYSAKTFDDGTYSVITKV